MTRMQMKVLVGAVLLATAGAVSAQDYANTRFTPVRSKVVSADSTENRCIIRVWVDGKATVYVKGGEVDVKTQYGRSARDQGTECTGALPLDRSVRNFRLVRSNQTRVSVEHVQAPERSNEYTGAISIVDPAPGGHNYELELVWNDPQAGQARRYAFREGAPVVEGPTRYAEPQRYGESRYTEPQRESRYGNGYSNPTFSSVDEEAACQQRVVDELRERNGDPTIRVNFRPNIRRDDVSDRRVKLRGNAWASGRNVESARITYECVVNERSNRVITANYEVRAREFR